MKISPKVLHIPPYLSTSWDQVKAIYLKEKDLIVKLVYGAEVTIPGIGDNPETVNAIFLCHQSFLESQTYMQQHPQVIPPSGSSRPVNEGDLNASFHLGFGNLESISSAMHHNPAQSHMPNLPNEILAKISAIAKIVAPEDIQNMPKPEAQCNCMHCQIARAIQQNIAGTETAQVTPVSDAEEEISDEDLKFQQWDIVPTGQDMYNVINRLDTHERYRVYLGIPVGCTCGKEGCEHILAVLKS